MNEPNDGWRGYVPSLTLLLAALGMLWTAAQAFGRLTDLEQRMIKVEATDSADTTHKQMTAERLARIEANLEFLVREQAREKRRGE